MEAMKLLFGLMMMMIAAVSAADAPAPAPTSAATTLFLPTAIASLSVLLFHAFI